MKYKEIFDKELNLKEKENKNLETKIKKLETKVQKQTKEIQGLKKVNLYTSFKVEKL